MQTKFKSQKIQTEKLQNQFGVIKSRIFGVCFVLALGAQISQVEAQPLNTIIRRYLSQKG